MSGLMKRIELQPSAGVLERAGRIALRIQPVDEPIEDRAQLTGDPPGLQRLPVVEGDAVPEPEPREQLTAVEPGRLGERAGLVSGGELTETGDVEADVGRVERNRLAHDEDVRSGERVAKRRERSTKSRACTLRLDLGPEERGESVTAMCASLERQEREQRNRLARVDRERLPVDLHHG